MNRISQKRMRQRLQHKKVELAARLQRIAANVRRGLEPDSTERAKQMEDHEVVDALGNDARAELKKINMALDKINAGTYGRCADCGLDIDLARLEAHPYATECIDCATLDETIRARS